LFYVRILLRNNFFPMRKIIPCSPHSFQQRFYSVKNIGYVIGNKQSLIFFMNKFYEPSNATTMKLFLRRTLVRFVLYSSFI
jgi:hypothetical protein